LIAIMITFMIWFDDCIIWSLNDKSILDLLMQHQYDIKIDVNAKYANQKKTEMKRITAKLKTVYVKKLKVWHKQNVNMRETKLILNLSQYRKKINDAWSIMMLLWLTWLLKFNQVTEIIEKIEENSWCIIDLDKNFFYHQNLNTLIEESSKIQFLQRHHKTKSKQSNWFIIFLIYLIVCFIIWLIRLLISTSYLQTLSLLFIMHIITFSLAKRLILQQWLLKIEWKVEWMHSQLSTNNHQKLVDIFQKKNKDEKKNLKIIVEEFQVMSVNYMMHRIQYVVIMKS